MSKSDTQKESGSAIASQNNPKEGSSAAAKEDDLDDLDDLDDYLDDFADKILSKPPGSGTQVEKETSSQTNQDQAEGEPQSMNLEELVKDLKIDDPETKKQFEQLVDQFEKDHKQDAEKLSGGGNFDEVMKATMERLKKSGKNVDQQVQNETSSNPEDMLSQLLSGLGGEGLGGDGNVDMSKLLVDMLDQLSSKEVLYEPIKDLNSKFPQYLEEKKSALKEEEHANYTKQYTITGEILEIFESPDYDDEDSEKRERVNTLLESLQEMGQPPSELIGDASDFPGFGGLGGLGGLGNDVDINDKDLPKDLEKELEEGCKQT